MSNACLMELHRYIFCLNKTLQCRAVIGWLIMHPDMWQLSAFEQFFVFVYRHGHAPLTHLHCCSDQQEDEPERTASVLWVYEEGKYISPALHVGVTLETCSCLLPLIFCLVVRGSVVRLHRLPENSLCFVTPTHTRAATVSHKMESNLISLQACFI